MLKFLNEVLSSIKQPRYTHSARHLSITDQSTFVLNPKHGRMHRCAKHT